VNRILSRAVKVAGSLAVAGGTLVAAAMPASAVTPETAWGVSAFGLITITPVAQATTNFTPAAASSFNYSAFVSTGGILDRASSTAAFSDVGSPKVYLGSQVNQLNASDVMSSCRNVLGFKLAGTTIQAGSISVTGLPNIPLLRNPAPNTKIFLPGYTITLNRQTNSGSVRTVTAIYVQSFLQTLSIGVSRC
jgi:hypothetical protein